MSRIRSLLKSEIKTALGAQSATEFPLCAFPRRTGLSRHIRFQNKDTINMSLEKYICRTRRYIRPSCACVIKASKLVFERFRRPTGAHSGVSLFTCAPLFISKAEKRKPSLGALPSLAGGVSSHVAGPAAQMKLSDVARRVWPHATNSPLRFRS